MLSQEKIDPSRDCQGDEVAIDNMKVKKTLGQDQKKHLYPESSQAGEIIGNQAAEKIFRRLEDPVFPYPVVRDDIVIEHGRFKGEGRSDEIDPCIGGKEETAQKPEDSGIHHGPAYSREYEFPCPPDHGRGRGSFL